MQTKPGEYLFHLLMVLGFILCPFHNGSARESSISPNEYFLKAVCMYNFTQFTRWPAPIDIAESEELSLGIVGESPFGDAIRELQNSLIRKGKKGFRVIYYGPYEEGMNLAENHLLFVSSSEQGNLDKIVASLENKPVLTISDAKGFLEAGGMISLVLLDNNVRWEISRAAVDASGIQLSAKLLQLAIRIENAAGHSELMPYELNKNYRWGVWQGILASLSGFPASQV